jgi:hypothetical protein
MRNLKSLLIALVLSATVAGAQAQSVNNVVVGYLEVKNALVASNASLAATKAKTLLGQIAAVKADAGGQASWKKYVDKLTEDTRKISEVNKVEQQREAFAALSSNIYQLLKATNGNAQALYVQYCPMKKASWLSSKKEIENPYYGDAMMTCGAVRETIAAK